MREEFERQDGPFLTEEQWDAQLRASGFSGLDGSLSDDIEPSTGSVMFSTVVPNQGGSYPHPTVVYTEESDTFGTDTLQRSFHTSGSRSISLTRLDKANFEDQHFIFWDDKCALRPKPPENHFLLIQRLLTIAKGVLWVTAGASSIDPNANLVLGLARVVRSETGKKIATLDLDTKPSNPSAEVWSTVLRVFDKAFRNDSSETRHETEFAVNNGRVEIPRLLSDPEKNDFLVQETYDRVIRPQYFSQEGRRLKLRLDKPGVLDAIHFEDDEIFPKDLGSSDIEISVRATGMNFKGPTPLHLPPREKTLLIRHTRRRDDSFRPSSTS